MRIKTFYFSGQTRNDLARSEIAFLAFLNRHSNNKENIPLDEFFSQMKDCDSDDEDQDSVFEIEVLITPHTSSRSADCSVIVIFSHFYLVNMGQKLSTSVSFLHIMRERNSENKLITGSLCLGRLLPLI